MSEYLQFGSSILANDSLAVGRVPFGASLDGQTLVDAFTPFRGDHATVFGRGRGPRVYAVTVQRLFSTTAAALQFMLTHEDVLPVQDDLTYVDDVAGIAYTMADAVAQARILERRGTVVFVAYTFTGSRFESDDVPDAPTDTDTVKAINQSLTAATASQAIAFDVPFASAPRAITLALSAPDGGTMFGFQIRESTRTAAGFTVDFDALVPASGYKLTGLALL